jgi:hypothetical protein
MGRRRNFDSCFVLHFHNNDQFFRGSDCMGMAYEFASKLGMPSAAVSRVRIVLEQHLNQYIALHNPTYDPQRPFETGLLPANTTAPQ